MSFVELDESHIPEFIKLNERCLLHNIATGRNSDELRPYPKTIIDRVNKKSALTVGKFFKGNLIASAQTILVPEKISCIEFNKEIYGNNKKFCHTMIVRVDPAHTHRRNGHATEMLNYLIQRTKSDFDLMTALIWPTNDISIDLFEKVGFSTKGVFLNKAPGYEGSWLVYGKELR